MEIKNKDFMSRNLRIWDLIVFICIITVGDWLSRYFNLNYFRRDLIIVISFYLWGGIDIYIYYRKLSPTWVRTKASCVFSPNPLRASTAKLRENTDSLGTLSLLSKPQIVRNAELPSNISHSIFV